MDEEGRDHLGLGGVGVKDMKTTARNRDNGKSLRTQNTEGTGKGGTQKFLGDYLRTVTAKQERKYHLLRISVFPVSSCQQMVPSWSSSSNAFRPSIKSPPIEEDPVQKWVHYTIQQENSCKCFPLPAIKKKKKKNVLHLLRCRKGAELSQGEAELLSGKILDCFGPCPVWHFPLQIKVTLICSKDFLFQIFPLIHSHEIF